MVPTLALGIPGSATTAIILGALLVHGLRPGPHLFNETPQLLYAIFTAMLLANLIFLGAGLVGAKLFARITLIPTPILWPAVFVLACIGSYALEQAILDVWIMVAAALLGFVLKRQGFAAAPIIMGLVLGAMVENTLKQSLIIFDHNWLRFLERPIVVTFLLLTLVSVTAPLIGRWLTRQRATREAASA
jgi:putative tricarboxylic transport membrane protein